MDEKIQKILEEKIYESTKGKLMDITTLCGLAREEDANVFAFGIMIGRLYNSFYYQSRRILNRSPTDEELYEFVTLLKEHETELKDYS